MLIPFLMFFVAATFSVSPAQAQRHGGFVFATGAHGSAAHSSAAVAGRPAGGRISGRRGQRGRAGYGYLSNYYPYYDSPFEGEEGVGAPPQRVPAQTPESAAARPVVATPVKTAEPLVVELRGDHWVRLTGYGASEISGQLPASQIVSAGATTSATTKSQLKSTDAAATEGKLPPAILVFRDGHREEISRYTIINKTIATKSDYYTSGSWTRSIPIAELNVPATLQANREHDTKFTLPSRPGEVVMRP